MRKKRVSGLSEKKSAMPLLRQQNTLQAKDYYYKNKSKIIVNDLIDCPRICIVYYIIIMHKYKATITIEYDFNLYTAILPEIENNSWGRSSYTISKNNNSMIITITADDATALRASFNNITKLLAVHEKLQ
jgi:tRNA threonylcarbamoyladenosine modification (KEOPS) complex  Pcc1 subunit